MVITLLLFFTRVRSADSSESPCSERHLEILRASCVGQPQELVNLFFAPMKNLSTSERVEKAIARLRERYGVLGGLITEPEIVGIHGGSVVEWLKHRTDDQHGLGSKSTCTILLCPWERHFTALFPAWWSWQAVLNYSNISTKLLADSNILASPEAGRGNCLPYVLALPSLSCESGG